MTGEYQKSCIPEHCSECNTITQHEYSREATHGILETHMVGSGSKICQKCGKSTHVPDGDYWKTLKKYKKEVLPNL